MIGAIIYYIVIAAVLKLGLNANDLKMFSAIIVALFLALPYWKSKYNEKHMKQSKAVKKGDNTDA